MKLTREEIERALATLELPVLVSLKEVRARYRQLAKRYHPDISNEKQTMQNINASYALLKEYMERYKFSFSEEEIAKQFPEENHAARFRF
ncbi:MAG: DnaJ domain-containing protein [Campylobacteraceae bacterium]|nr:DnaJ domain-containing protein [Campylobacteraceae bacterium]